MEALNPTEKQLRDETHKWLSKIREDAKKIELLDSSRQDMVRNIYAYISDCEHFIERGNYVLAFEAVVWAWSWLEILERLGVLRRK